MDRPRLRDIADHAQVSVSTVSRYLRGQIVLRPETEARIKTAVAELGLAPAVVGARAPIGVVFPALSTFPWANIADEVTRVSFSRDASTLIATALESPERHAQLLSSLADGLVSGIITTSYHLSAKLLRDISNAGVPVVLVDTDAVTGLDSVVVDNHSGAFQAVSLLTAQGHRNIAMVAGYGDLTPTVERRHGWADALSLAGIDPDDQLTFFGDFTEEFGMAVLSHLRMASTPPTAVFAGSDVIATGLMTAARQQGMSLPDELSIASFDGSPLCDKLTPPLTSIQVPHAAIAAAAVRLVMARWAEPDRPAETVVVPVALRHGASVAPCRARSDVS
ncbi:LacI family DNA-binding transcriptional regulator [Gordonia sp. DT30]|uniref:LacI family DNA-binding transcriptional regulator n=1 Tax=unclassified Gordonia (in: high G+C Gram-positive bacteria) TaxID=2657482 RepID=UPI003CEAD689